MNIRLLFGKPLPQRYLRSRKKGSNWAFVGAVAGVLMIASAVYAYLARNRKAEEMLYVWPE